MEIWKEIQGYELFYMASTFGRVKSLDRIATTKSGVIKRTKGKILKLTIKKNDYLSVMFSVNGKIKRFHVQRVCCAAFHANPLNLPQVNHKDGNKRNNHKDNLEWTDAVGNSKHAMDNELIPRGEKCKSAKLTNNEVLALKRLFKINPKFNKSSVARKLKISDSTVHKIIKQERWKHI